ncbi:hypothetical protein C4D60_Mb06t37490 [Musa balbisiana]|uniref:Uncharacterized protein n=1 Tax=Musa balbisiana TaxID=52838 RepID=A0A4S8ITG4_MUSBA|nr:hypothetical protein C4D60_Mb06t37490 [Musa balbisiana]
MKRKKRVMEGQEEDEGGRRERRRGDGGRGRSISKVNGGGQQGGSGSGWQEDDDGGSWSSARVVYVSVWAPTGIYRSVLTNLTDPPEPDVFMCLSRVSFFSPTEGGFNIFRIFEKGKDTHVQSSEQVPEKKINWISSIFKVDRSKTKESEPDKMFSGPSSVSFKEQMEDWSKLHDPATQITSTSGAMVQTKKLIYVGVKDVRIRDDSGVDATTEITSQIDRIIPGSEASATEVLAHSDVRINATKQTTRDAEISDDRFSGPSGVSFEEQMEDQPELHDSVTQTISTSEAMIQTKELTYAGVKDNDGRMRDNSGVDATKITSQSHQIIQGSEATTTEVFAHSDVRINVAEQTTRDTEISNDRLSGPSSISFKKQMEDQPELHDPATQTISTSEAMIQIKESIDAGVKDNDVRMRDDSGVDATKVTSQSDQIIQGSEATTTEVLAHSDVRINVLEQIARDTEISNDRLSGPSSVSFKGHMEDQSELHDPATRTINTLGAMFQIKESIDAGVKENDVRLRMMDDSEQTARDTEISNDRLSGPSSVSYKEQMEDQPELQDPETISTSEAMIQIKELIDGGVNDNDVRMKDDSVVDANKITSQSDQIIQGSDTSTTEVLAHSDVRINVAEQTARDSEISNDWDILKSIVYGGLNESITSLAVVSSAAGADVSTLKIVALGLAKLIGGFLLITHELFELRTAQDEATEQKDEQGGRYWELLGWRANFRQHFLVATISYILFGLVPPVVYGFSFRRSDEKEFKLVAVAASSLLCTALLALCKAHVKPQKGYVKTMVYYLVLGVSACGPSYLAGMMIEKLLEKLGLFDHGTTLQSPPTLMCQDLREPSWTSY